MSEHISQRELRNDSGRIMRGLDEGRSFVVTRNGRAVGELRPMRRERLIDAAAAVALFKQAPAVGAERLRADLDVHADPDAEPRA